MTLKWQKREKAKRFHFVASENGAERPRYELDIRGMRYEQAVNALSEQVDRALLLGLQEFNVIHGTGEGVLQKAVHDYLKSVSAVKDYYFSHPDSGGTGKQSLFLAD